MDNQQAIEVLAWLSHHPTGVVRWTPRRKQFESFLTDSAELHASGPGALLSGSFDPLHMGHREMRSIAEAELKTQVEFELSITNAAKPAIEGGHLAKRLGQFDRDDVIWITQSPTFHEKSKRFRPQWFIVGVDTILRIADDSFYGHSAPAREAAFADWAASGIGFLVFGRSVDLRFHTLDGIELPETLRRLCRGITRERFEIDISSTKLRDLGQW